MGGNVKYIDSIEIFKLLWKTFQRFGTFEEYKETLYNKRVRTGFWRLTAIRDEFKEMYYEKFKESMLEIKEEEFFDDFYETIEEKTRKIYDTVLTYQTASEALLIVKNYDIDVINENLRDEIRELNLEISKYKQLNYDILHSRSWLATKPLRSFKSKFR